MFAEKIKMIKIKMIKIKEDLLLMKKKTNVLLYFDWNGIPMLLTITHAAQPFTLLIFEAVLLFPTPGVYILHFT